MNKVAFQVLFCGDKNNFGLTTLKILFVDTVQRISLRFAVFVCKSLGVQCVKNYFDPRRYWLAERNNP